MPAGSGGAGALLAVVAEVADSWSNGSVGLPAVSFLVRPIGSSG